MRILALSLALIGLSSAALAQDVTIPYIDNRSDPASLMTSFYNAINRAEYSRAYSYFGEGATSESFEAFAAGYADTRSVEILTGDVVEESAMSATYYSLPIAIEATQADGSTKQFSGCYLLRLTQPSVQEPPVVPMHIEKTDIAADNGALHDILPDSCNF